MRTREPGTTLASGLKGATDESVLAVAAHGYRILSRQTRPVFLADVTEVVGPTLVLETDPPLRIITYWTTLARLQASMRCMIMVAIARDVRGIPASRRTQLTTVLKGGRLPLAAACLVIVFTMRAQSPALGCKLRLKCTVNDLHPEARGTYANFRVFL